MRKRDYTAQQQRVMKRIDSLFATKIESALKSQISSFTNDINEVGLEQARVRMDIVIVNGQLVKTLKELYKRAALPIAKWHYKIIEKQVKKLKKRETNNKSDSVNKNGLIADMGQPLPYEVKGFGLNDQWIQEIITFFNQNFLSKLSFKITETVKDFIRSVIDKGITEGWGVQKIVDELESTDFTRWKSRQIVRTESVRAMNYSSMLAANEFDYQMQKEWIEVKDNRTRRSHRHATGVGGEIVDFEKKYSNGLMFPGDPEGGAGETVNCRCVQSVLPKTDENGFMIERAHKMPLSITIGLNRAA